MSTTSTPTPLTPEMAPNLGRFPEVQARLGLGYQFNAWETAQHASFMVGIGPITDLLPLARTASPEAAELIADALRLAFGQPVALCRISDNSHEGSDDE